ncbi:MAG TPA: DUF2061 domain-containing protein [Acetobacteraceae bacterium]|jgi:uncharacterized membrane protein|nr:DUF2061 domain-containing protein [Acetobacteraceae bacterium]
MIRTMARQLLVAVAVIVAAGWSVAANAQKTLSPGATVERVLRIDGKQVPLPGGTWVVAADTANDWNDQSIGAFGYLRTLVLFHVVGSRIDTMLEVNTNVLPTTDGWGMAADCARADLVLAVVRYRAGWDGSCYFVTHTLMAKEPTTAWRKARDFAVLKGWQASRVWLTAGFRTADRSDVLDVRFHFAPETRGITPEAVDRWQDSGWMSARLDNDPQRYAFAHALSDWTVSYSSLVDAGLKNRLLNDDAIAMPQAVNASPAADVIARRLAELELLRQAGTITPEEYAAQATALKEHGLGSSSLAPDIGVITAVKAISYRVIVSVSHIFVDYYWTGNYVAAGALEVLQITINSTKFYFHELAWAKYMGIPRTDSARTLDFKYIGVDV